jgi:hypothetical protein
MIPLPTAQRQRRKIYKESKSRNTVVKVDGEGKEKNLGGGEILP